MKRKQIKVLHVIGKLGTGGIEKIVVSLYENIDREKIQFDFLLFDRNAIGFYDVRVKELGAQLKYIDAPRKDSFLKRAYRKIMGMLQFFRKNHYYIVHIHGEQPTNYVYAFFAKKYGTEKVIMHAHNTVSAGKIRTFIMPLFRTIFGKYVDCFLACSEEAAEFVWPTKIETWQKAYVLNNGIEVEKYLFNDDTRKKIRIEQGITDNFVIGHVGRFSYLKNHVFLLDVFKEILTINQKAKLVLIGDGEEEDKIHEMVRKFQLEERVDFVGTVSNVQDYLMAMDVMCFPSIAEGLGIVVVEAQAAALHVVASDRVPSATNITKYIEYLSLEMTAKDWAVEVCKYGEGYPRCNMESVITGSGYSIVDSSKRLENLYLDGEM